MSRSTDPGHFFQTSVSLSEAERKAKKSSNNNGIPIKLRSKILAVATDPDDTDAIYVAEAAGTVKKLSLENSKTTLLLTGPTAPLTSLALSTPTPACSSTRTLFAGCWDKAIYSWQLPYNTRGRTFVGHADFVKTLLFVPLPGRDVLLSGAADGAIFVWDVASGAKLSELKGHERGVLALTLDPVLGDEGKSVVVWSADSVREIRGWSVGVEGGDVVAKSLDPQAPIVAHETSVNALRFDADGDLWTASSDKTVKCLSRERGWAEEMSLSHPDFVRDVVVDERGGFVVTACRDEEVRVWERGSGELRHTFSGHFEEVTGLLLLGQLVVSISIDATVRRWSLAPEDLRQARLDAERAAKGEVKEEDKPKESLMTEEEERELAELMDESD
ncbi:WD domain-containing protein [Patellaria atrata CBS 101060]|uniref:WD domain-containing protein n=1 Tax=Patellaria atrata CBS 101060 TaxID=1346257 RepID=A0A9P4VSF2_9PEZI|nr:WD domain-containing protein [Patellaria atrata CBS 101060]